MAIQNEPSRITIPFAASGTKNTIPETQSSPSASQAASWTDGFPAQCSLPLSAGGIPPARADFNGIFNAITQSERFTQEGGVWLWNNAVDYAASRMVLGSDGKLYWSVAQCGPNVGGAVDPTTDSGAYWVKLPSMADIAAQGFATQGWVASQNYATQTWVGSQGFATQTWVKTISVATVYLDPAGSDSNDGLSAATAVATFAKAVEIAGGLPSSAGRDMVVQVAAGTYTGELAVANTQCLLVLQGDVTINGRITTTNSRLLVYGPSHTLTVATSSAYAAVEISRNSYASFGCILTVSQGSTGNGIVVSFCSRADFDGNVNVGGSGTGYAMAAITTGSFSNFSGGFSSFGNTGYASGIIISDGSNAVFGNGIWIGEGAISGYAGLYVSNSSSCAITGGAVSLRSGSNTGSVIDIATCSSLIIEANVTSVTLLTYGSSGEIIAVTRGSTFVYNTTGGLYLGPSEANLTAAILSSHGSSVSFLDSGNIGIDGTYSSVVWCLANSTVFWSNQKTSSGSATGRRYNANICSSIYVDGGGQNIIPGSAEGTLYNYSYYG